MSKKAVFTFGRFNPPTIGHKKLINLVQDIAEEQGMDAKIYPSMSYDHSKNPIPFKIKTNLLRQLFPKANIVEDSEAVSPFHIVRKLAEEGYDEITMVVGEDRVQEFKTKIGKYQLSKLDESFDSDKNFDAIFRVVSAGERNPFADDITGISGSKMREYVMEDNFDEFAKGFPSNNLMLTRKTYAMIGRSLHKLDEDVQLDEGINDPGIFKAVFIAGGPGSGKDFVVKRLIGGTGLVELNSDTAFEALLKKNNVSMIMRDSNPGRDRIRGAAKATTKEKQRLIFANRLGIIINGTGDDVDKFKKMKKELESIGYETSMIFVNVADEVSKQRNFERGQRGGREVPENIRAEKWSASQKNIDQYKNIFLRFKVVDNSADMRNVDPETKKKIEASFLEMHKFFRKFIAAPVTNKRALEWIEAEKSKRNVTQHSAPKSQNFGSGKQFESLDEEFTFAKAFERYKGRNLKDEQLTAKALVAFERAVDGDNNKGATKTYQKLAYDVARTFGIDYRNFLQFIRMSVQRGNLDPKYMIEDLAEYADVVRGSDKYQKLVDIIEDMPISELEFVIDQKIPRVSKLAFNRHMVIEEQGGISRSDLKTLEQYLDKVWGMLDIDVSFTKHFLDRVNDARNKQPIELDELRKLFIDAYKKYGSIFKNMGNRHKEIEGVLSDLSTKINTPFVLKWDRDNKEFDLVGKTVMRKAGFKPNNSQEKKYTV